MFILIFCIKIVWKSNDLWDKFLFDSTMMGLTWRYESVCTPCEWFVYDLIYICFFLLWDHWSLPIISCCILSILCWNQYHNSSVFLHHKVLINIWWITNTMLSLHQTYQFFSFRFKCSKSNGVLFMTSSKYVSSWNLVDVKTLLLPVHGFLEYEATHLFRRVINSSMYLPSLILRILYPS